jgi:hypothetical protein
MNRSRKSPPTIGEELSPTFEEDYLDVDGWPNVSGNHAAFFPLA